MAEGVDGLLRDRTRPPGIAPLAPSLVDRVVALTLEQPDLEATHWTVRAMTKAIGIATSSVVKIWHDHGLTHPPSPRSGPLNYLRPDLARVIGGAICKAHGTRGETGESGPSVLRCVAKGLRASLAIASQDR